MHARRLAVALVALALVSTACSREAPAPPQRVENAGLGITVAAVPDTFELAAADGETIELVAPEPGGEGRLVIAAGPVLDRGINLVEAVQEVRQWYESTSGATYLGNRELGTPIGTAFTARGTYQRDGEEVEETKVFAIHPLANRLLTVTFTYPPGHSEARVQQLMALLGEIEGLA
jgi:hypothetical protein